MKEINLRGVKESLSEKEMKLVKGGVDSPSMSTGACAYFMRCDSSSSTNSVSDCSRATTVATCGAGAVNSGSVLCTTKAGC